ncbi:MAG TPA: hypothetical protein VHE78_06635 [Gemmatimonadaceae bacterium]|nr:hypothetical protein [Gemmatimonadaceae bacterium]
MTLSRLVSALALATLTARAELQGQPTPLLDSILIANSRVLRLDHGALTGDGAIFLLNEASRSQFVALGEQHNATEIPEFTTALFRALQQSAGYQYLADEQDPITLRYVSSKPVRGDRDSVLAFARRYQHAFTFMSDQELAMLSDIARASRGGGNPLRGCDQAFGATHILDRVIPTVTSAEARALATSLRDWTREKERVRDLSKYHFMAIEPKSDSFARLVAAGRETPGAEAAFLTRALVVSDRIYRNYREHNNYENGYEREQYMKERFLDEYRRALSADQAPPRVVLKFGHWHVFRGEGPSNLQTLGNFVSEFATANDSRSFHIAIFPYGDPGGYGDITTWTPRAPFLLARGAAPSQWTIVDLRPLRRVYSTVTKGMSPEEQDAFRRWVYGFDAALYVGRMRQATFKLNPGVAY